MQEVAAPVQRPAAEARTLERILSDLVNQAYALTTAEIEIMREAALPRMPIPSAT